VNEQITKGELRRQKHHPRVSIGCPAQTLGELRYWLASDGAGHCVDGAIWPDTTADDLPEHGQLADLRILHEMAEYVSDPPATAPRRDIPAVRRERGYFVCDLKAEPANFLRAMSVHLSTGRYQW
jgi:hypothetical protein